MKTESPSRLGQGGMRAALALSCLACLAWLAWQPWCVPRRFEHAPLPGWPMLTLALPAALAGCVALGWLLRRAVRARDSAVAALRHAEGRHQQLMEAMHEGVAIADPDGTLVFVNQRLAAMLGLEPARLLGRLARDFVDEAERHRLGRGPVCAAPAVAAPAGFTLRRADGGAMLARIGQTALPDADGRVERTLIVVTDITERGMAERALLTAHAELEGRIRLRTAELLDANLRLREEIEVRKAAERALAHSEARLQELIAMMPVALCLKDADSRITMMNQACEQQWGAAFDELEGTLGIDHFPAEQLNKFLADDQVAFAQKRLIAHEELVWNGRLRENRVVQTYKKPTFHADGRPHQLILLGIDVTERRLAEEALRHSFLQLRELSDHQETIKDQERRRIALDIHDDLGQNLMALKIDIGMLHARAGARHPRLQRHVGRVLETIDATIRSVRNIINDLHPSTLELGLCAAVEWLLKQFERHGGIVYTLAILDDGAVAGMDKRQTLAIFRIIQESLANIVRHAQASEVHVSLNLAVSGMTIVIADNGIGMQPGDRGKAASFGLKSIKERIAAFGGELSIDSRAGSGTALSILMPAASATGSPSGLPSALKTGRGAALA